MAVKHYRALYNYMCTLYINEVVISIIINPLTLLQAKTGHDKPWPFFPLLMSSLLIKISIIYTHLLQEEIAFRTGTISLCIQANKGASKASAKRKLCARGGTLKMEF